MKRIRLLDEDTINKIAAGEVIERPASVVKELVENSIDAGAGRILIELSDSGPGFIRVTDDGCGIPPEDLPLAFQKHATSKIRDAGDLNAIRTLGFRGEALSSIASVSESVEVRTRTRTKDTPSGSYLRIEGGRASPIKEIGSPAGTSITVWNLFYNVPARKKHLKGPAAELVHITDVVSEMAIIHHDVSFELFSGKRRVFNSARSSTWDDVLVRLFGLKEAKSMRKIRAEGPGWSLEGVIGDPLSARRSQDRIHIFVNERAVGSRALAAALREAYRNMIPLGRSPIAILSLKTDPKLVDVNVHPSKREIRLLHESEIASAVTFAASKALEEGARSRGEAAAAAGASDAGTGTGTVPGNAAGEAAGDAAVAGDEPEAEGAGSGEIGGVQARQTTIADAGGQSTLPIFEAGFESVAGVGAGTVGREAQLQSGRPDLVILGQLRRLYIVAEGAGGLVLIDQHAAAERIRFEGLLERYRERNIRQELVEPVFIELSLSERLLVEEWMQTLQDIGFELSPFGGNAYSVRAVPALGSRLESADSVHDILRELFASGRASTASSNRDEILKLLACRGSIKSGHEMTHHEMKALLDQLFMCKNPLTCPHGRPVMVTIEVAEIERMFLRR